MTLGFSKGISTYWFVAIHHHLWRKFVGNPHIYTIITPMRRILALNPNKRTPRGKIQFSCLPERSGAMQSRGKPPPPRIHFPSAWALTEMALETGEAAGGGVDAGAGGGAGGGEGAGASEGRKPAEAQMAGTAVRGLLLLQCGGGNCHHQCSTGGCHVSVPQACLTGSKRLCFQLTENCQVLPKKKTKPSPFPSKHGL